MKKNLIAALCCMLMIGLFGCQQAEEIKSSDEKLRMSIEASIGKDGVVAGRTALGSDGSSVSFVDGDAIGLFVDDGDLVKWTYDNDKWGQDGAPIYWEDRGSHNFYAFYPYVANATLGNVSMPNLAEQTGDINELGTYDFLVATKEEAYTTNNGTVSFTGNYAFGHVFALIAVTLKGEGDLLSTNKREVILNKISIRGTNIVKHYAYSFENSEAVSISDEDENENGDEEGSVLEVALDNDFELTSEGVTFYFVVNTGTVDLKDVDLSIGYSSGDQEYVATLEGMEDKNQSEITTFISGNQYSYALKVTGGQIVISGNEITKWNEGIKLDDIIINGVEQQKPES